ncbi:Hypothetical protein R9X50_00507000 [Acrodontium crateriforme]|uniref:WSC domain-containing protein n=1 Tax=Acrodontium crateriforme TaxID=150365 RepID=A0AAQ3M6G8_9PEZI|nr:Hypothetical protein R9X50_00507000 [Acrodontium crateriforme]
MLRVSQLPSLLLLAGVPQLALGLVVSSNLPTGWTSQGCYTEATNSRALTSASYTNNTGMTEESCISFCSSKSLIYAGVEYSSECYCGNSFADGSTTAAITDCNMACSGNSTEACGGGNRLNVFWSGQQPPAAPVTNPGVGGWSSLGCYSDNVNGRALPNGVGTTGGASSLTIALCTQACNAAGYTYAGAEYAGECYCGNAVVNGGVSVTSGCNMVCNGNGSEYCGGPNRLNVYTLGTVSSSSSSSAAASSTAAASTSSVAASSSSSSAAASSSSAAASPSGLPTGWSYKGCWVDNANGGRVLQVQNADNSTMTVESCTNACQQSGYKIAGLEYSTQCFCGNQIIEGGALASSDSDCNMACGGNSAEMCGAGNRLSVYSNDTITTIGVPVPQNTSLPGSWKYSGCVSDNAQGTRALPYQIISATNNSAEFCLSQCSAFGYMVGGMEYGEECYCGDLDNLSAGGSISEPEGDCNMACSGNGSYICGGGNRISLYTWQGTPLYEWQYPTGAAAGSYEYFMPGLVVPLITVAGKNGKITFVEKHGTSYYPNSTGAFELDPSFEGDFAHAWREMDGITTDVFCSAGLVLPDKGARQINIGGWSGESTYGIRFYTPNGELGTNSTNMWEENYNEIALQAGRWYPSAMQMANGSILVVGGEDGSNGNPVPSLELLPPVGGTVYCQWLKDSDPYNLYPFLAVLPGGGIFTAYYNEARILDPGTLQTTTILPGIPGLVNNPGSGRTYPLEGTSVLLPQHAPYTDPVTVLICGGSNPGAAIALDNCVSIQPEAANPQWTLERMPSQRVMSCMAALPDGTYLILNGAHQGTAGFGLATSPNLNAVLYDPTQPIGARMSVMANTTIARLYHSEATLMDDGRVLVSGSDPQDGVHPEEMRVEVFNPPYILSGAARPSFTISNTDWSYGQTVTFTVSIPSGGAAKVSLIGAVASTHGNSMGQRSIFPAVSCSGTSCTVTAPPNANVSPPGWFQMFVLDGPTPSKAQWVRIGGDPGFLGEWPTQSDFTRPGS